MEDKEKEFQEMQEGQDDVMEISEDSYLDHGEQQVSPSKEEIDETAEEDAAETGYADDEQDGPDAAEGGAEEQLSRGEGTGIYLGDRMYDERTPEASEEAWKLVYDARDPSHRGVLEYRAIDLDEFAGEKYLKIYIPDVQTGVEGLLPESKAGLGDHESMEDLKNLPYVRVTPERIYRDEGYCILNRELAERISRRRTFRRVNEGDDIEAIILGVNRNRETGHPRLIHLDAGGVPSYMPVHEVDHNYVEDVSYVRGEKLKVRVIGKERPHNDIGMRFRVSRRALFFNPWMNEKFIPRIGTAYTGNIVHESERLLHIKLPTGIEVLAKRPSLNYRGRHNVKVGKDVKVYITYIDREKRRAFGNLSPEEARKEIARYNRRNNQQEQESQQA